ncbi:MAG: penicillin-binding protein activator, partial [Gammaproteobacteria bacterium]|nr:penicillin-binding protein activator [Gammaproteobacteria bacterium]
AVAGLLGCGGGSDDGTAIPGGMSAAVAPSPSTTSSAEGLWQGTTSASRTLRAVVLEDGTYWALYSGVNNPDANQDLNGISFCEMPWILAPNQLPSTLQILQRQIQTSQPTNYIRLAKFYAMGIDSFNLATQFRAMQSNPQLGMSAATGTLYLTSQHVVYRQLTWAQFQNGQPQLIH